MFRRIEDIKGGPGDPKTAREWWGHFKGWPLRVLLVLLSLFAVAVAYTLIHQVING